MSDYLRVLDSAEKHLLALKTSGVRFLTVEASTMTALSEGAEIGLNPAEPQRLMAFSNSRDTARNPNRVIEQALVPGEPIKASKPAAIGVPSYDGVDTDGSMNQLRDRALACLKCPHLVKSRKNVVFGVGDIHAQLMFVGEAPGADEDAQGEPFVGAAGQLLTRIIKTIGLSRETVYIANILKCRPDTPGQAYGNRKPTPEEMKTCLPYLLAQIDLIRPKVIVALGLTAIEGLLGKGDGIGKLRGKFQVFRNIPLMPTFHPAYLLRNQALSEKRKVWEDMLQVMEKLEMPASEKQKAYFLNA
jgi:uracil-DNA glycosylase family 4